MNKVANTEGIIVGLEKRDLDVFVDDRGILSELIRTDWPGIPVLKQVYLVQNLNNSVRAFHKHAYLTDYFCIVKGNAKFIFIDDRVTSISFGLFQVINVSDKKLQLITVPPGVYHGWCAKAETILISGASTLYKGEQKKGTLDEERIPWSYLGEEIWQTQNK